MGASTAAGRIVKSRILNDAGIMGLSVTQPKEQSKNAAQDQRASKEQPGLRNADQSDENNAEDNNQTDRVAGQASSTVAPEWNDLDWVRLCVVRASLPSIAVPII